MQMLDLLDMKGNRVTGLAAPTVDSDAATRAYVLAQISGAGGMTQEQVEDIISTTFTGTHTGITFTYDDTTGKIVAAVGNATSLGGQTLAQVRDFSQTTGQRTAASAISDFSTAADARVTATVTGAFVSALTGVDADTLGGSTKAQVVSEAIGSVVAAAPSTLDTLNELALALGSDANFATTTATSLAARVRTFAQTLTTSATTYTITHNLGTRDVQVQVYETAGNFEQVWCTIRRATVNTVTLIFATAPTASQYRVVVQGRAD